MQPLPLVRDLPLAVTRLGRRVAEVDLVVQVATLRRYPGLVDLQPGQLLTELVETFVVQSRLYRLLHPTYEHAS